MTSSQEKDASYSAIKSSIESLIKSYTNQPTLSDEEGGLLLILETSNDVVGFAVVNGEPQSAFGVAYGAFQNLYRRKHKQWNRLNLSFVVCRVKHDKENDAFFTTLETNVYFCRKYVICVGKNSEETERELLRLPFFPLPEGRLGGVMRPASAQTFIQSLGASAQFARQIVVPREYAASTIVDEILGSTDFLPSLGTGSPSKGTEHSAPSAQTRIRNITVEAFRAYNEKYTFDVDANVVVLYGPNGLGKTSFFDALDYACTGRIGRLCRHRIHHASFAKMARHLGAGEKRGSVTIELDRNGSTPTLCRTIDDWGQAQLGPKSLGRTSALQFLTAATWGEGRARIENLEKLFRATHLFSQSTPELLSDFEEESKLSFDVVSRMLALDDYASALTKIRSVLTDLRKREQQGAQEALRLDEAIFEANEKIGTIRPLQTSEKAGHHLTNMVKALAKDLLAEASINITNNEFTPSSLREWRAMVEAAAKAAEDERLRVQRLESGFDQFEKNRASLRDIAVALAQAESNLKTVKTEGTQARQALESLDGKIATQQLTLKQAIDREASLSQFDTLKSQWVKATEAMHNWQAISSRTTDALSSVAGELEAISPKSEALGQQIAELSEQAQGRDNLLQQLRTIEQGIAEWGAARSQTEDLEGTVSQLQDSIQTLNTEVSQLKEALAGANLKLANSEQSYQSATTTQKELTNLLDRIEAFVNDGVCPTCGTDHHSRKLLLERINDQKESRLPEEELLAMRCEKLRCFIRVTQQSLESKEDKVKRKRIEIKQAAGKLIAAREIVARFEKKARELGIQPGDGLAESVASTISDAVRLSESGEKDLADIRGQAEDLRKRTQTLQGKQKEQAEAQNSASKAIEHWKKVIAELQASADAADLSLEMPTEKATKELDATRNLRANVGQQLSRLVEERGESQKRVESRAVQTDELSKRVTSLRENRAQLENDIQRYEKNARSLLENGYVSREAVEEQRRLAGEKVDLLDALRIRCLNLERTLDSAQRSATLASLEAEKAKLVKQKKALSDTGAKTAAATAWCEHIKAALDLQSSSAVAEHVESLGPLTTLIQQRLRAVYGFSDVRLASKGNEIRVEVGWGDVHLKPADYFSDSQKQILMLSIFLAERITQTWSGFAPILLDDPVTHFDDLNAFGFVELIRGLVMTLPGKRQFFISTCEDRLFDLMRKKFSGLNGGTRFYRFSGMDGNGPIIENVSI